MGLASRLRKIAEDAVFPFHFGTGFKDQLKAVYVYEYLLMQANRRPLVHSEGEPGHVDRKKNIINRFESELKESLNEARKAVAAAVRKWWEYEPNYWYPQDPIPEVERGIKLLRTVRQPFKFLYMVLNDQVWRYNAPVNSAVDFFYKKMPKRACPQFIKLYRKMMRDYGYADPLQQGRVPSIYDSDFENFLTQTEGMDRGQINEVVNCIWTKWLHGYLQTHGHNNENWNKRKMEILDTAEATFKKLEHPSGSLPDQIKDFNFALNLAHNNGQMIDKIESYVGEYDLFDYLNQLSNGIFIPQADKYLKNLGFDLKGDEGTMPMYRQEEEGKWLPARKRLTAAGPWSDKSEDIRPLMNKLLDEEWDNSKMADPAEYFKEEVVHPHNNEDLNLSGMTWKFISQPGSEKLPGVHRFFKLYPKDTMKHLIYVVGGVYDTGRENSAELRLKLTDWSDRSDLTETLKQSLSLSLDPEKDWAKFSSILDRFISDNFQPN